jgi:hypothetical protein
VAASAWPFLVGRSERAGSRVIVAPSFMMDSDNGIVELSWLARGETGESDAFITELPGMVNGPATAVFRVFIANRADYLEKGTGPLSDFRGRPIHMTEGIVIPLSRAETSKLRLATAHLDTAHEFLKFPYRDFWRLNERYSLHYSRSFPIDSSTRRGIPLTLREWPLDTGNELPSDARPPEVTLARVLHVLREKWLRQKNRLFIAIVIGAAGVVFAATLGVYNLVKSTPAATSHTSAQAHGSAQVVKEFCSALMLGNIAGSYALLTPSFRAATTEAAFSKELLGDSDRARSCTVGTPTSAGGGAETGTLTLSTGNAFTRKWAITLARYHDKWLVSHITAARSGSVQAP